MKPIESNSLSALHISCIAVDRQFAAESWLGLLWHAPSPHPWRRRGLVPTAEQNVFVRGTFTLNSKRSSRLQRKKIATRRMLLLRRLQEKRQIRLMIWAKILFSSFLTRVGGARSSLRLDADVGLRVRGLLFGQISCRGMAVFAAVFSLFFSCV